MNNFMGQFGSVGNVSKGSAFRDQSAGYMTGGSLFVRSPVQNQRVMNMQLPGYRAGCGGIDLWTGGMSYINAEALRNMMQSIISNTASYAFMLAVETYAPQIHNIMHQLNKLAADFNRMNINSCEASAALLGGMWPKSDLGSQAVCRMVGTNGGGLSDYAKARHECGVGGTRDTQLSRAADKLLVGEFNLAWKILDKLGFLMESSASYLGPALELSAGDRQVLKEIFMTLSGTVIHRKTGTGVEEQVTLPSKADREEFINALMKGGKLHYYKCDEHVKCLKPTLSSMDLSADEALQNKIGKILDAIVTKIQNDQGGEALSEAEITLINASHLPVYKIINVTTAFQRGRAPININQYGELIAFDVIYKYINDVFDAFQDGIQDIRALQFTDEHIKPFVEGIRAARGQLNEMRHSAFEKMDILLSFVEKTLMIERQVQHMAGSLSNEYEGA